MSQSDLAQAIQDVTDKASLVIREEIELAKTEVTTKVTKLGKGIAVAMAAGVFLLTGLIYFLHALSWFVWKLIRGDGTDNFYLGFLIVAGLLFVLAIVAGLLAFKFVKGGSPPVPEMAIEEGKRIKETFQGHGPRPEVEA